MNKKNAFYIKLTKTVTFIFPLREVKKITEILIVSNS